MRVLIAAAFGLTLVACGDDQASARFERVEDRAEIENPNLEDTREAPPSTDAGYRHEAPLHVDEEQETAPPAPGD